MKKFSANRDGSRQGRIVYHQKEGSVCVALGGEQKISSWDGALGVKVVLYPQTLCKADEFDTGIGRNFELLHCSSWHKADINFQQTLAKKKGENPHTGKGEASLRQKTKEISVPIQSGLWVPGEKRDAREEPRG